jgi:hypothetical protein
MVGVLVVMLMMLMVMVGDVRDGDNEWVQCGDGRSSIKKTETRLGCGSSGRVPA